MRRGYLLVLAATFCWATSGTFIKIILQTYGLSAWTLAFWRDLFTFSIFLAITASLGISESVAQASSLRTGRLGSLPYSVAQASSLRGGRLRSLPHLFEYLRVERCDLPRFAAMGAISIGIFHVLWALAVMMIPVAVATVLNYTSPAFVVLFAWVLWRERLNRRQTLALVLAFAGCVLVTGAYRLTDADVNWPGLLVGLSTGLTYGLFTIIGKPALKRYDSWTVLTYAFGFATLTLLILQPGAALAMFDMPLGAWLWILILVLVSTVTGFSLYMSGLKHLSASSASITATLEPVIATGFAYALLGEVIGPVQMLGGVLVIGAVILLTL